MLRRRVLLRTLAALHGAQRDLCGWSLLAERLQLSEGFRLRLLVFEQRRDSAVHCAADDVHNQRSDVSEQLERGLRA